MKKWSYPDEKMNYVELILNETEERYHQGILEEKPRAYEEMDIESISLDTVCCFTGNRPSKLQRSEEDCKRLLVRAVMDSYEEGYRIFISGMAEGVDRWAAMAVLTLRCFYPEIRLVAALPFPSRSKKTEWNEEAMILSLADECCVISEKYWAGAYEKRNRWMVLCKASHNSIHSLRREMAKRLGTDSNGG